MTPKDALDQVLAIYLPMDRRHALATGPPLPERTQGAALFADISAFTPLTEALTRGLGARHSVSSSQSILPALGPRPRPLPIGASSSPPRSRRCWRC